MDITDIFLKKINTLTNHSDSNKVIEKANRSILDYLAVTCAGAKFQQEKLKKYTEFSIPENGDFNAIGTGKRYTLKEAVFLNGLNGHALDFDDGTNSGIIHLGSPIFSLLLPLAQRYDISMDKMLHSAIIGYETSYTMAVSIQPQHKAMGYHATGTCGVLGATIAASYMLDFTDEERFQAFAAACAAASGVLSVLDDGSQLKPYNVAKSSLLALTSIQLAKAGFKGNPDPLGSSRGFFKMMTGDADIEMKPLMLNGTYAIMKSYTKPYASCRYTHPSVEAAIHLRERYHLKPECIERIDIETYSLAVSGHDHTEIQNSYSAKMSIPYSTAVGMIFGKVGLQEFEESIVTDQKVLSITQKVHVKDNSEFSNAFPEKQTAVVVVKTKDGNTFLERVDYPKGEPENPLIEEEFRNRYNDLMEYAEIDKSSYDIVYDMINQGNIQVRDIMKYL